MISNLIMWNAALLGSHFLTITGPQMPTVHCGTHSCRCSRHRRGLHYPVGHGELKIGSPLNVTPAKHRPKDWQVQCIVKVRQSKNQVESGTGTTTWHHQEGRKVPCLGMLQKLIHRQEMMKWWCIHLLQYTACIRKEDKPRFVNWN